MLCIARRPSGNGPLPSLLPLHCWQARAFAGGRTPALSPLWGWHCPGVTLFPTGAPKVRARGGLYCGRSPAPPVRPLAFPEQHRQSWPLSPAWKTAGGGVVLKNRGLKSFLGTRGVCGSRVGLNQMGRTKPKVAGLLVTMETS